MHRKGRTVGFMAMAWLLAGCQQLSSKPEEQRQYRTFPAPERKLVRVHVTALDVEVSVAPSEVITVETHLWVHAPTAAAAMRWLARRLPSFEDSPAALEIRTPPLRGTLTLSSLRSGSLMRLELPPTCSLEITTTSGDVSIDGAVTLTAPVRIVTTSGDVSVRGGVRSLTLRTTSGDLKATGRDFEQLQLRSTSGDATVRAPLRTVLADTTSGDLRFQDLAGDLAAHTTSGDLRAQWEVLPPSASVRGETISGDVHLRLPAFAELTGELRTRSGSVHTDAAGQWARRGRHFLLTSPSPHGPPAGEPLPRGRVEVSTRSGDITLQLH